MDKYRSHISNDHRLYYLLRRDNDFEIQLLLAKLELSNLSIRRTKRTSLHCPANRIAGGCRQNISYFETSFNPSATEKGGNEEVCKLRFWFASVILQQPLK